MGCWLVVLSSYIYRRFVSRRYSATPLLVGGYRPVGAEFVEADENADADADVDEDNGDSLIVNGAEETVDGASKYDAALDGRIRLRGWRVFLLAAPACCDIAGTTLMNVGLLFVAASIYQMTRGALVLFVGLFSVLFLGRRVYIYQWFALFVVVLGVALVGLAGALFSGDSDGNHHDAQHIVGAAVSHVTIQAKELAQTPIAVQTMIGVLLIAAAQIFTAFQFVIEEWILENYAMDPLQVVGWEGIFGFVVTIITMIVLYLAVGRTEAGRYGYFDVKEGWREITTNRAIVVSSILIMISIGWASLSRALFLLSLSCICDTDANWRAQWIQLFRPVSDTVCFCYFAKHNRHVSYAFHLARFPGSWLGVFQVATSPRVCDAGVRDILVQRHRHAAA